MPSNPPPANSPGGQLPEASATPEAAGTPTPPPPIDLSSRPQTWFAPLPAYVPQMGYDGSVDYDSLFAPGAPWTTAQAHVRVSEIPASWVMNYATADELAQLVW